MLHPNNKQRTKLFQCFRVSRFAYNWALNRQQENYKNGGKFISAFDLRNEFTQLKKLPDYVWLNKCSKVIPEMAIIDACNAYKNFFKGNSKSPKFKSKKGSKLSFYVCNEKIEFTDTHVKLMKLSDSTRKNRRKLNWVRLAETGRIPTNCKYSNPRVTFDGINFWISVSIEVENSTEIPTNEGIGIDLGIKDLAICSDGNTYPNINKTKEVKRLEKKKKRLQRKLSKKYLVNKYEKTKNTLKLEKELLKLNHRLTNIRQNYIHQVTTEIINRKPMFISLEELNVSGMMKNRHLAKAIQEQSFYSFKEILSYKTKWNNIQIIEVPRFYPSSKTCSVCGTIKSDLKLSDRVFVCSECGNKIDRDLNASINLKNYGLSTLR
jgi:transposase, IS605 orfB family